MVNLFDPVKIGAIECANRIFMAPLTRTRNFPDGVPAPWVAEYYAQRASAGLIVAEATAISQSGMGFLNAPGIWFKEQIEGWRVVTDAVHEKGGKIVAQLWHGGRIVYPTMSGGLEPVAPSAGQAPGLGHTWEGKREYPQARALSVSEIKEIVRSFAQAARNAMAAGFDGVQIHAANGYLIDTFLRDSTNERTDEYGGTPENRMRFLKEICEAVIAEIGADKVGVRLSPNGEILGCVDSDPAKIFVPVAEMLNELNVSWLALKEANPHASADNPAQPLDSQEPISPLIRKVFKNVLVLNGGYDFARAQNAVETGFADAISFGRDYISNPDLVERFKEGAPLAPSDSTSWYGQYAADKTRGYTDYADFKTVP